MPLILGAQSAVATGFSVDNSCRFNDDDGAYLSITPGAGNQKTATWSVWCKYSTQGHHIWGAYDDATHFLFFNFNSSGTFEFRSKDGGYVLEMETDAEFRDPAAWYHVCIALDTTESVEADRAKIWMNGVQITSFSLSSYPSLNADIEFNTSSHPTRIADGTGAPERTAYEGYMAEFVFIDGTAYEASDFGEFDEDSPTIWKPKDVSGLTFGTNGYYLDFEDSADLGNDVSGEGNNFASTNLAAIDQTTDTPTNNFATMNPLDNYWQGATFAEGNLAVTYGGAGKYSGVPATIGLTAGKWYWEVDLTVMPYQSILFGIASRQVDSAAGSSILATPATEWAYYGDDGKMRNNNAYTTYGDSFTTADILSCALDLDNLKLYFAKNGTWQNSGVPTSGATGTGALSITAVASTPLGAYFPAGAFYSSGAATNSWNFGNPVVAISSGNADGNGYGNFEYAVPSGYLAICTKNLGSDGG